MMTSLSDQPASWANAQTIQGLALEYQLKVTLSDFSSAFTDGNMAAYAESGTTSRA
jgi:hypothetical protein